MIRAHLGFTFALLIGTIACGEPVQPDGAQGLLSVGEPAPDLIGRDADDKPIALSTVLGPATSSATGTPRGRLALVYFYPKDGTPGCTKQACALRDNFAQYEAAGITIFGVSRDSEASHRAFRQAHALPFVLVADESGAVQNAYGVPSRAPGIASRVSFLIGPDGKVARVWSNVDPVRNPFEVLEAAKGS